MNKYYSLCIPQCYCKISDLAYCIDNVVFLPSTWHVHLRLLASSSPLILKLLMGEKPVTASLNHIKEQHADKGAIVYCAIMASQSPQEY